MLLTRQKLTDDGQRTIPIAPLAYRPVELKNEKREIIKDLTGQMD